MKIVDCAWVNNENPYLIDSKPKEDRKGSYSAFPEIQKVNTNKYNH
jgi:hypothetical protein